MNNFNFGGYIVILALCVTGAFVYGVIRGDVSSNKQHCLCVCEQTEGCEIQVFKNAKCAIGPEDYSCCVVST